MNIEHVGSHQPEEMEKTTVMEKKKHLRWRVTELCWEIYATSRHGHSKDCKMWTWSTWYPCTIITSISIYNQRTHRTRLFTRGAPLAGSIQRPSCTEQVPEWPAGWAYFGIEVCSSTNLIQFDHLKKYMYYYVTMYFNIQVAVRKATGCLYLFGSPGWSRGGPGRPRYRVMGDGRATYWGSKESIPQLAEVKSAWPLILNCEKILVNGKDYPIYYEK